MGSIYDGESLSIQAQKEIEIHVATLSDLLCLELHEFKHDKDS
jgi:hypothetical protein